MYIIILILFTNNLWLEKREKNFIFREEIAPLQYLYLRCLLQVTTGFKVVYLEYRTSNTDAVVRDQTESFPRRVFPNTPWERLRC